MGRLLLTSVLLVAALLGAVGTVFAFSGEDLSEGDPWHHENITQRALAGDPPRYPGAGFSRGAAEAIAWHADYVDSYAYNPLWWLQGEGGRLDAVLVGRPEFAKLHFDDVFSTTGVLDTWQRYAAGTLAGLYWASMQQGNGDVTAGQNILGASLHAVQDFYSHSNWIDDVDRRCQTFLQTPIDERGAMSLHTGSYDSGVAVGPHHHGAYSLSCSLFRGRSLDTGLEPLCSGLSPLQNLPICETFRACSAATNIPFSIEDRQNNTLVYLDPPGIALDSTWMARIQAKNRGLLDADGNFLPGLDGHHFRQSQCQVIIQAARGQVCSANADMLFAGTKDLAIRASTEWVNYLEAAMTAMGPQPAAFWNRIKSTGEKAEDRIAGFEDLSLLPYLFLSAGPYPQGNASLPDRPDGGPSSGWFLRLGIETENSVGSGTDADIYLRVFTGETSSDHLLDRLPTKGPFTGYDDFEEGDFDAYMVGPFAERPTAIALVNDDGGLADVAAGAWAEFTQSMDSTLTSLRQTLIALVAGNADYVGTAKANLDHATLKRLLAVPFHDGSLTVDGGDQGAFRFDYRLRPMAHLLTSQEAADGWLALEVQVRRLQSLRESVLDRFSDSDEPFVLFLASPLNGRADPIQAYLSDPIVDFDQGETHSFARRTGSASVVKIPPNGGVVLSLRIFESDSETQGDREVLRRTFESGLKESELTADARFFREIGRMITPDWTVSRLEVFAFERSAAPLAGPVLSRRGLGMIEGGETGPTLALNWSQVRALASAEDAIGQFLAKPVDASVLDGKWHATGLDCPTVVERQRIDVAVDGDALTARKTLGDPCLPDGSVTWTGTFADGVVTATVLPGDHGTTAAPVPEPRPNHRDPAIDPNIALEGNWYIEWHGESGELPGYATLSKGGTWTCLDRPGPGGCWYQFVRDPAASWHLSFFQAAGESNQANVTMTGPGALLAEYGYFHFDYSDGRSIVSGGPDGLSGHWEMGDRTGGETWTRVMPEPRSVAWVSDQRVEAAIGAPPITVVSTYSGPVDGMRGNRPRFYLQVMGEGLWGLQDYWMPEASGLEIASREYICAPTPEGYETHGSYEVCLRQGGVIGLSFGINVWAAARPGLHTLYLNDAEIEFNLELQGYPEPPAPRTARLELQWCNVLAESDPPEGLAPLVFTRSAPLP